MHSSLVCLLCCTSNLVSWTLTDIISKLLAESDDGSAFMVYNRWGRVGIKGQDKLFGPYTSRDSAIQEFEQKFFAKTKNHWSTRKEFICLPKSYTWLEMDYGEQEKESDVSTPDSKFIFFLKVPNAWSGCHFYLTRKLQPLSLVQ